MSDQTTMQSATPMGNNPPEPDLKIEWEKVIPNEMEPTKMSVQFLISSTSPAKALALASESELVERGMRLVREKRLFAPALNNRSLPEPCDAQGNPLQNPSLTIDPESSERYYYKVTIDYEGDD